MKQVLHQKRWNSSARCIQYAATIIQLTLEVMQDHLLKAETNEYIGSLLTLLHSSDVHIKVRSGLGVLVLFFGRSASYLLFPSPLLSLSLSPSLPPSLSLSLSLSLCPTGVGGQFNRHDCLQSTGRTRPGHYAPRLYYEIHHCCHLSTTGQVLFSNTSAWSVTCCSCESRLLVAHSRVNLG